MTMTRKGVQLVIRGRRADVVGDVDGLPQLLKDVEGRRLRLFDVVYSCGDINML